MYKAGSFERAQEKEKNREEEIENRRKEKTNRLLSGIDPLYHAVEGTTALDGK